MKGLPIVPVNEPLLNPNAEKYVLDCVRGGWVSSDGPYVERFEQAWADYCGMPYGVAVSNGTAALQIAVSSLRAPKGSEVIVPTFTIISCVLAVIEAGLVPVLVDVDPATWCMNLEQVQDAITPRTVAIMPVHMYGHPVDMQRLAAIADRAGLTVIEDAAEAHGARCRGQVTGSFGAMSCFSFYANKIITTGEGGMVLTRSTELRDRLRSERNLGFNTQRRFLHHEIGHNYRLTSLQAALGLSQVEAIDEHVRRKRAMAASYQALLSDLDQIQLPVEEPWATNVYWMYGLVLREDVPFDATEMARRLADLGISTRPFFVGMHLQPVLQSYLQPSRGSYPVSDRLTERGLYLPSGLTLTEEQIQRTCSAVRQVLENS